MNNMVWNVFRYDINSNGICKYNIFSHSGFTKDAHRLLKENVLKEELSKALRRSLAYHFRARCEHEIIITSNPVYFDVGRKIDVYQQMMLNWDAFVDYVWSKRNYQG